MILMQLRSENNGKTSDVLNKVRFLTGYAELISGLARISPMKPFDSKVVSFLNDLSKELIKIRDYSDVVTFGFWIRSASVKQLESRCGFCNSDSSILIGRGVIFHIAPSNVPVNFAYSLVSGLLTGNVNVVKVPSKDFPQIGIIIDAINRVLCKYEVMRSYIICVRYERDKDVNDLFSDICDMRIIWGGDKTVAELRKSSLPPRSGEITFADRYSLAVIDSDTYLVIEDKERVAENFYNDTFFSDQNACTSPRVVIWTGSKIDESKKLFWKLEYELVKKKYTFQDIMAVNKLTKSYLVAVKHDVKVEEHPDNLIIRVKVLKPTDTLMGYRENSGYFYEYDCQNIRELMPFVNDRHCQTIGYIGDKRMFTELINLGVKGIDRVVPIGRTMDFDLIWDGYNLMSQLTRTISFEG